MKPAVVTFLTCLLVLCVQGQSDNGSETCKCSNGFIGRIQLKHIKAGPFIYEPSVFCRHTEITIITTANKKKCVNPESPLGKLILGNNQKMKAAVSATPASHQTNTLSSSSPKTTSKL
uniref:Chemokine interleukin-8-like domain-containing protein n=1 Tax=Labrus bergylta TaxID=56723 RepID=A0A3Q3ECT0_9LABR